jgi:CBS domain-containing protein
MFLLSNLNVGKFENKHVYSVSDHDTIYDAVNILNDFSVRNLPVLQGSSLIGMIGARNIVKAIANNHDRSVLDLSVKKYMGTPPKTTVTPNTTYETIIKILYEENLSSIPIIDNNILMGMISEKDIVTTEFLWVNVPDYMVYSSLIGININSLDKISITSNLWDAAIKLSKSKHQFIATYDDNVFRGLFTPMDLISTVSDHVSDMDNYFEYLSKTNISKVKSPYPIFRDMPILLSEIREEFGYQNQYEMVLMRDGIPSRVIGNSNLIEYLYSHLI